MTPQETETFLLELCALAAKETLPLFRAPIDVANKAGDGFDPVTHADRQAEAVIRQKIIETFPDHGIIGEEHGDHNAGAEYQWIIDPIDGTRAFISGLPLWGTLIGLYKNAVPFAGVMSQPFIGETYLCDGQEVSYRKGEEKTRIRTSGKETLSQATLMTTSPDLFNAEETGLFKELESACQLSRYGADCYAYCLLASGHIELVVESGLHIYDIAALIPIVEKAGGVVTDWRGRKNPDGGQVIAAANRTIHESALERLNAQASLA